MKPNRPELSKLDPEARDYILYLEGELERLQTKAISVPVHRKTGLPTREEDEFDLLPEEVPEPLEEPTTICVITSTASGIAKRTPRHLYARQRRGGMGVFDLDTSENDPPVILAVADLSDNLLVLTNQARAFRLPVNLITETPIRARGESILKKLNLDPGEKLAQILPERAQGYVALVSERGMVRLLRHHVFGEYMKPGAALYDLRAFGALAGACWTPGDGDLFIATRQGRAIRFSEKSVSPQGTLGIRLGAEDEVVGITAVYEDSSVFLLSTDGRGTIRLMEGFTPNKSPGAGGKIAINTDQLVGACNVDKTQDIFIISRLGKIIRFRASEIPSKDGVVQGVVCMSLRADAPVAIALNCEN